MSEEVQTWHDGLVARHWAEKGNWIDADAAVDHNVIAWFARK
jgi:hypothetical protein